MNESVWLPDNTRAVWAEWMPGTQITKTSIITGTSVEITYMYDDYAYVILFKGVYVKYSRIIDDKTQISHLISLGSLNALYDALKTDNLL